MNFVTCQWYPIIKMIILMWIFYWKDKIIARAHAVNKHFSNFLSDLEKLVCSVQPRQDGNRSSVLAGSGRLLATLQALERSKWVTSQLPPLLLSSSKSGVDWLHFMVTALKKIILVKKNNDLLRLENGLTFFGADILKWIRKNPSSMMFIWSAKL